MDISQAIAQRQSVRAFKSDPVPKAVIREILEKAVRAPSWANTQPWEFVIAGGKTMVELRKACEQAAMTGTPMAPDIAPPGGFPEPFDTRRRAVGKKMFDVMGIPREDKEKRMMWGMLGFKFFDAPNAIFILTDRSLYYRDDNVNVWPLFDCGLVAQNILLLATDRGLGTIPEIQAVMFPGVLRKMLNIPDSKLILLGIALGYPDGNHLANKIRSDREPVDSLTAWHGFE